ncbi:MAG: hypothetical protein JWM33_2036 [Caulobacteraceae bacterium]|nr:hypothetical protein [Caulobacteraceae bacterium]
MVSFKVHLFARALIILPLSAGAPLGAVAAATGPDSLPGAVVGVIGSGNELSLRLTTDGAVSTLKVGESYADGWRLQSLSAAEAVLTKGGETHRVGLNPSGALAGPMSASEPPSRVDVAGDTNEDIARALLAAGRLKSPRPGLSTDETTRFKVDGVRLDRALAAKLAALGRQDDGETILTLGEIRAALGPGYDDWLILDAKEVAGVRAQAAAQLAASGAVSFYVPAGADLFDLAAAAGVPPNEPASFTHGPPDASGGMVYTRAPVNYVSAAERAAQAGP